MTMHDQSLSPESPTENAARGRLRDWGDRLCCAALLAAGLCGAALLAWYCFQMPALR